MGCEDWRVEQKEVYDKIVEQSPTKHQYIYTKETLTLLDEIIPKKGKILDIGCGTGHVAQMLKRNWYAGVDISPKSIGVAKQFYKVAKVVDITDKLPFRNNMFDVVLSLSTLHHVFDCIPEVVKEVGRVLKPSGQFIIIDHNSRNIHTKLIHSGPLRLVPCKHEKALNYEEIIDVLVLNNFKITEFKEIIISADQQALKPHRLIRLVKVPFLLFFGIFGFKEKSEFLIIARRSR